MRGPHPVIKFVRRPADTLIDSPERTEPEEIGQKANDQQRYYQSDSDADDELHYITHNIDRRKDHSANLKSEKNCHKQQYMTSLPVNH
jgi:hypothetical protein